MRNPLFKQQIKFHPGPCKRHDLGQVNHRPTTHCHDYYILPTAADKASHPPIESSHFIEVREFRAGDPLFVVPQHGAEVGEEACLFGLGVGEEEGFAVCGLYLLCVFVVG
jgi:hypothetical protein